MLTRTHTSSQNKFVLYFRFPFDALFIVLVCKRDGVERRWTLLEFYRECLNAARSLIALGVQPKRGVAILGFNAPEWFFGAIGGIFAGYVKSRVLTTLYFFQKDFASFLLRHSRSRVLFDNTRV